jgi:PAS domain S-box-containing protein
MSKRPAPERDPVELRRLAELQAAGSPSPAASESDLLRQWHELQVSHIELEMQNAALAQLEAERDLAAEGRDRYAQLYDEAPAGYFSIGTDGRITRANRAGAALMERSVHAMLDRPFEQFVAPEGQAGLRRFLLEVFEGKRCVFETTLFGSGRHVRIEANLDPEHVKCRMIVTDMGDASAREAARRRAFEVLDCIGEGVLMCGPDQQILAVNPAFTRITGYLAEQALGRNPRFLARHDAHPASFYHQARGTLEHLGRWQGEVFCRRRDGVPFVASLSMTVQYGEDGELASYIGVFADIIARKQAEAELQALSRELDARVVTRTAELTEANRQLQQEVAERKRAQAELHQSREQLRKLADHLQVIKEEERKRIARDIHDELGQNLLALRLDLAQLHQRSGVRGGPLHQRAGLALDNLDATVRSVRGIMNDLRPAVLDLGLQAAIEWQVAEFRKRSGDGCRLQLQLPPEAVVSAVPAEMAIVVFRSLQEALGNVARHAQASSVSVALDADGEQLSLTVADNGIGITPADRAKSGSFGLVGIAERVAALGGRFELAPYSPGAGCSLRLRFDLAR